MNLNIDALHQRIAAAFKASDHNTTDTLMRECDDGECSVCAWICCPHHDIFHFHHDGCPTCSEPNEYTEEQVDEMNRQMGDDE